MQKFKRKKKETPHMHHLDEFSSQPVGQPVAEQKKEDVPQSSQS